MNLEVEERDVVGIVKSSWFVDVTVMEFAFCSTNGELVMTKIELN